MVISRRGQALIELAIGMFALAIVAGALCGFGVYIARSLRAQNELRKGGVSNVSRSDSVEVDCGYIRVTLPVEETVVMPERKILW